ncbi:MAG: aldehyde dehydrogenase family protein, partial [Bacteroidota bacterium]
MEKILNLINGQLVAPVSDSYIDNYNPSTGNVYSLIPDSDERDVELAVDAAKRAFPLWRDMTKEKRSAILIKLSELIQRDLDKLALAESVDNGKPLWLSKSVDIPRA